ncbi:PREDICTED: activating signal cointegrator 1 complex subunit 2 homolog [Wasmannia auropunctata]|uniref:activating signal cointegrator 1 complex subunit 2 homolog n=1 Tax=Wasmannia auropunctata TaxID=64793 RepID=UPI0005F059F0|nr:PREDICTED: activating signal cointegrator 1 complex subunit 2 homolog [Wasmannia auropunctata]
MRFLLFILVVAPVLGTEFHSHIRERRQAQQANYRAYNQAPAAIKQILAAQQYRDPLVHLPPQPVPNLAPARPIEPQYLQQNQLTQYRPNVQVGQAPAQPTYKDIPVRPAAYTPPASAQQQYNPQYRSNYSPQPLPQPQQQQQAATNYQYSRNLPPQLQQLVQIQQNLPNAIPQGHQG